MKKLSFKRVYCIYLFVLLAVVIAALTYVYVILNQYEKLRPERCMEIAIEELSEEASKESFWTKYSMPEIKAGKYEEHMDIRKEYLALFNEEELSFSQKTGAYDEDELFYDVKNGDIILAEVKLKAQGPAVTKLAVFSFREWQIESVKPILEAREYTISVPDDFDVRVNDIGIDVLEGAQGAESEITYTIKDVYLKPTLDITDKDGNVVKYTIKDGQIIAEFYNYRLTIPDALVVEVNGQPYQGEKIADKLVCYEIKTLDKPQVIIRDYYGNEINYEGEAEVPLTYMTITADSGYTVEVEEKSVPEEMIVTSSNKEYEMLAEYVGELPQVSVFNIAILKEDAEVLVKDENGKLISLEPNKIVYDFTMRKNALQTVPEAVGAEIDVLKVAQLWSLFMSNDASLAQMQKYLIEGSYQYDVTVGYATGVDSTFTSEHTLMNPTFTEISVDNFVWIADNCFSVDISFVKHMILRIGTKVEDPMNDRFYFVKYDDTDDNVDNPTWKLVGMKEIVSDEK